MVASLVSCAAWAGSGAVLRRLLIPGADGAITEQFLVSWFFITLPFGVAVYFAVVGAERAVFYFFESREARLTALRAQLNPHFLFNSLNAITVLVRDGNTEAAGRMLELLSDVLRQVLRTESTHETTLAAELEFLERYLAIEQVRFSDRLRPLVEIAPGIGGAAVPRFLLQPLVENALRHGIARRADAGVLQVRARREGSELILTVEDDGPGLALAGAGAGGVGLANTRARLAALYGERASLEIGNAAGGGVVATVRLPYHEAESHAEDPRIGGGR